MAKYIKMYTDGSARKNPNGPGGYGVVVHYINKKNEIKKVEEFTGGFKLTTNNRMEMMAVIVGLESLNKKYDVTIVSDSKYVVNAINEGWLENWEKNDWLGSNKKPVKNRDLWMRLRRIMNRHNVKFEWIRGHAGHKENERCDYLATRSSLGIELIKGEDGLYKEVENENK